MPQNLTPLNLDSFLANSEKRAYRMALLATKQPGDALDIVQESMLKLVQHYSDRAAEEWAPLFQTILQNNILQWHRNQTRFKRWFSFSSDTVNDDDDTDIEPEAVDLQTLDPETQTMLSFEVSQVIDAIGTLAVRQQQAFLLRAWEGYDTAETAKIMGCSAGSVKTHFSRAISALKKVLGESGDE